VSTRYPTLDTKAGLQPSDGQNPDYVVVDETVIQLDNQRFFLYVILVKEEHT
jgi:hypothetical protein